MAGSSKAVEPFAGAELGPAMTALPNDRWRMFVVALYSVKPGRGAYIRAARIAGFGTPTSSPKSLKVIAHRLAHDPRTQAAIREEDQHRLRASAPGAIAALTAMVANPNHRHHAKAVGMLLDRTHPVETTHTVRVQDVREPAPPVTAEMIERIVTIARRIGLDAERMPPMIDVTPEAQP